MPRKRQDSSSDSSGDGSVDRRRGSRRRNGSSGDENRSVSDRSKASKRESSAGSKQKKSRQKSVSPSPDRQSVRSSDRRSVRSPERRAVRSPDNRSVRSKRSDRTAAFSGSEEESLKRSRSREFSTGKKGMKKNRGKAELFDQEDMETVNPSQQGKTKTGSKRDREDSSNSDSDTSSKQTKSQHSHEDLSGNKSKKKARKETKDLTSTSPSPDKVVSQTSNKSKGGGRKLLTKKSTQKKLLTRHNLSAFESDPESGEITDSDNEAKQGGSSLKSQIHRPGIDLAAKLEDERFLVARKLAEKLKPKVGDTVGATQQDDGNEPDGIQEKLEASRAALKDKDKASPRNRRGEVSPRPKRGEVSPRPKRGEVSPHPKRGEVSPHPKRGEVSPHPKRGEVSPRPKRGEVSPRDRRGEVSPRERRGDKDHRNGRHSSRDREREKSKKRRGDAGEAGNTEQVPAAKKAKPADSGVEALTGRTGGAYIPPARLRAMQAKITDKTSVEYQRISWEALKKSINGLVNKVNVSNIENIVRELFQENIVRGRGVMARSIIQAQAASPTFTHVYAALVAVVNTKFPQNGELILRRLVIQFRRGYKRNDKTLCLSATKFIAHLVNQQVAHEVIALEVLTLLLEKPTDDSVEVAVGFLKEVGQKLTEVTPRGINAIFEQLRKVAYEEKIDLRVQYMVEVMFAVRKDHFKDFPALVEDLDLVEEEDQFTHLLTLEDAGNPEDLLNIFRPDPNFQENEEKYAILKKEILGEGSSDEEGGSSSGSDSDEDSSNSEEEEAQKQTIIDQTETNMVALKRTIYLTIQSSLDFEECAHKLMKLELKPGQEVELCYMILDCCAQQRTYEKFFGLLAGRFCMLDKKYVEPFQAMFKEQYETIHRLETNKLRNVAKFFAHLLHTDSISWAVLLCIKLNEDDTTSASRIFIKILFQELSEYLGLPKLNERLKDPTLQEYYVGLLPRENPRDTRFAINFFTTIGLGGLTDDLRDHLKVVSKKLMQQKQEEQAAAAAEEESSSSDSSSSESSTDSSSDSESSDDDTRRKKSKRKEKEKARMKKQTSKKDKDKTNRNMRDRSNGTMDRRESKVEKVKGSKKSKKKGAPDIERHLEQQQQFMKLARLANYGDIDLQERGVDDRATRDSDQGKKAKKAAKKDKKNKEKSSKKARKQEREIEDRSRQFVDDRERNFDDERSYDDRERGRSLERGGARNVGRKDLSGGGRYKEPLDRSFDTQSSYDSRDGRQEAWSQRGEGRGSGLDERGRVRGDRGLVLEDRGRMRDDGGAMRNDRGAMRDDRGAFEDDRGFIREDRGRMRDDRVEMHTDRGAVREDRGRIQDDRGRSREDRGRVRDERRGGQRNEDPRPRSLSGGRGGVREERSRGRDDREGRRSGGAQALEVEPPIMIERTFERLDMYETKFERERQKNIEKLRYREEFQDFFEGRGEEMRGRGSARRGEVLSDVGRGGRGARTQGMDYPAPSGDRQRPNSDSDGEGLVVIDHRNNHR